MNFRYKLMRFMSGRYGIDMLFYILFAVAAVLSFANCFVRSVYLQLAVYIIVIYSFFRIFSRNTQARRRENEFITNFSQKLKSFFAVRRQRSADITHIYKKCPYCGAVLRLPRRKGRHITTCPRCGKSFKVRVFRER